MQEWNPEQYLKFKEQRTLPAFDLAMRISGRNPKKIVDIGCGPGNSTEVLKSVFPEAQILGIDSSEDMIKKARKTYPDLDFSVCGAADIESGYDIIFSNACLQWIPDHKTLIADFIDKLSPGGVLAVQIPANSEEPFFKIISEVVSERKSEFENNVAEANEILSPEEYFDILSALSPDFDIWETVYYHEMPDLKAIIDWVRGTRLRPYLAVLDNEKAAEFESEILSRAKKFYKPTGRNTVIFKFRRLFFTASK